jgi:hypothetical protein
MLYIYIICIQHDLLSDRNAAFLASLRFMSFRRLISLVSGHEGSYQKLMVGARASGGRPHFWLVDLHGYLNDVNLVSEKWVKHQWDMWNLKWDTWMIHGSWAARLIR